jgi:hypothetical protein
MALNGAPAVSRGAPIENSAIVSIGRNDFTQPFGDIYEIIIVPSGQSVATKQQMEGYAAWKWGLSAVLPANHPYKNSPPTAPAITSGPVVVRFMNRMINETLRLAENIGLTGRLYRVVDEPVQARETFLFARVQNRMVNEPVNLIEPTPLRSRALARLLSETVQTVESTLRLLALNRMVNEPVRAVETIVLSVSRVLVKMVNETLSLVESFAQALDLLRMHNEVVEDDDTSIPGRDRVYHWDENIEVPEAEPEGYRTLLRLLMETETVAAESTDYARDLTRTREDDVTVSEDSNLARSLWRIVDESIFFNELTGFFAGIPSLVCSGFRFYAILAGECAIAPMVMGGATTIEPEVESAGTMVYPVLDGLATIEPTVDGQTGINPELEGRLQIEECD